jgi:chromosome segregation ATPase
LEWHIYNKQREAAEKEQREKAKVDGEREYERYRCEEPQPKRRSINEREYQSSGNSSYDYEWHYYQLKKDHDELTAKHQEVVGTARDLESKLMEINHKYSESEKDVENLRYRCDSANRKIDRDSYAIDDLEAKISSLKNQVASLKDEVDSLREESYNTGKLKVDHEALSSLYTDIREKYDEVLHQNHRYRSEASREYEKVMTEGRNLYLKHQESLRTIEELRKTLRSRKSPAVDLTPEFAKIKANRRYVSEVRSASATPPKVISTPDRVRRSPTPTPRVEEVPDEDMSC